MKKILFSIIVITLFIPLQLFAEGKEYWIHGTLSNQKLQQSYMNGLGKIVDYYANNFDLDITLISEAEAIARKLDESDSTIVICGPVNGFKKLEIWNIPQFSQQPDAIKIGELVLNKPNTGIYLQTPGKKLSIYTGLSLEGYNSIFTVPTGQYPLTVLVNGQKKWTGKYVNDKLQTEQETFRPAVPATNTIAVSNEILQLIEGESFNEKSDLSWLKSNMSGKKVLFIGETHWSVEVPQVRNRILFDLARELPVKGILLELPFSVSAFYQHYINLADDKAAHKFLSSTLNIMVSEEATMEFLEMLRIWNRENPSSQLSIGTIDMEWNSLARFKTVFAPIFSEYAKNGALENFYAAIQEGNNQKLLNILHELYQKISPKGKVFKPEKYGGVSVSAFWVKNLIKNYIDTMKISNGASFNQTRQQAIVRNITDPGIFGQWFKQGKVIIHGGAWHGMKTPPQNKKEAWLDAAYLEHVFPETKGQVCNLYIGVIGHSFARVRDVTFDKFIPVADLLKGLIQDFNFSLKDGSANINSFYSLFNPLSAIDLAVTALGDKLGTNILRIKKVAWKKLEQSLPGVGKTSLGSRIKGYDHTLVILRGTIDKPRRLPSQNPDD
jgi:hypothetical protein